LDRQEWATDLGN